jgi:hypothetical protein
MFSIFCKDFISFCLRMYACCKVCTYREIFNLSNMVQQLIIFNPRIFVEVSRELGGSGKVVCML